MIQNLKVDVLYYKTATDFEMEFNLCGCCRMRLLTDKSFDAKSMVSGLAKAVNRSRIVFVCGPLFSMNGTINLVSNAISRPLVTINNREFGINTDSPIEIIAGSTPLVTPDGCFGGCIIESGPQTMILLTENRQIRKTIMRTLIHPYIEDVNMMLAASGGTIGKTNAVPENVPVPSPVIKEEPNPAPEIEPEEETQAEPETELQTDEMPEEPVDETVEETEEETVELNSVVKTEEKEEKQPLTDNTVDYQNGEGLYFGDSDEKVKRKKKESRSINIMLLIFLIVLLIITGALAYFLVYVPFSKGIPTSEYISEIFNAAGQAKV